MTPAEHYELDLDAVRTRAEWYRANSDARGSVGAYGWAAAAINSAEDVPALLAEVERLRVELAAAREIAARMAAELGEDRDLKPMVTRDHYGWPIDGRGRSDGPR